MGHHLEGIAASECDAAISQTLEAEQRTFVDAVLLHFRFGQVDRFDADIQVIVHIIADAGVQLTTCVLNDREAPREA